MRKLILIMLMVLIVPTLTTAICCEKGKECIISETCQDGDCGDCSISVYNRDGSINISYTVMTEVTSFTYIYNVSTGLSAYGTYPYAINCTTAEVCQGDCYVENKSECSEEGMGNMFAGIGILLGIITIAFVYFAIKSEQKPFQVFFFLLSFLMIIADFRFASFMVESLDPSLTGLIHNLDTMYMIAITLFRWLLVLSIFMVLFWLFNLIREWKTNKKERKSEQWELGFNDKY